jgi:hypothetical protein
VGGWAAASFARWPKFRTKSSKGAGEKKSWSEEFVAKFWQNFAEKGLKKFFLRRLFFPEFAELFSCTGRKIILGPGNTGSKHTHDNS